MYLLFATVDEAKLRFDANGLFLLNVILGLIMYGVALDLRVEDFKRVWVAPKSILVGLFAQLLLLPALTFCLILLLKPFPSIALGMILVAACPGGNISNFITHLSKGNTSLSVSMTAVVSVGALLTTPFNISFWGSMYPPTAAILKEVQLNPLQMLMIVLILLGLPLFLGMITAARLPKLADKIRRPFKVFSLIFFVVFILIALSKNIDFFLQYIGMIFVIVLIHNALAFSTGYSFARLMGLSAYDRRAITIEVGIQNSGLGLILIFDFFNGLGGMAIIAAWWGIWHIVAGLTVATIWSRWGRPTELVAQE